MYINFKSEYNFLQSYATLDKIVSYAKVNKLNAIGICDYETTFANLKFIDRCTKNDIKPIVGCEFTLHRQNYLLYAKNHMGIRRLNELVTTKNIDGELKLAAKEPNLILVVGRGDIAKEIIKTHKSQQLESLLDIFDQVFFGIYANLNDSFNYQLIEALHDTDYKTILIDQINCINESDLDALMTLNAIKNNNSFKQEKKNQHKYKNLLLRSYQDVDQKLIDNYNYFEQLIDIKLPEKRLIPPSYPYLKPDEDSATKLTNLCKRGLVKRLNNQVTQDYIDRLKHELDTIISMQYADYFLIMWDIILHAKKNNIYVGAGRGSAAGSLVSYTLGITEVDPVANNLIFERFLNPERISMPDIDVDFEDTRRNEVVQYMIDRFGGDNVVKIATVSTLQAKSVFRDVAKMFQASESLVNLVAKELNSMYSITENLKQSKKLQSEIVKNTQLKIILDVAQKLEGLPRQTSIHAAGVIMVEDSINNYCAYTYEHVSEAEAEDLEALGLLKFDILSLSNLGFIHTIVDKINVTGANFKLADINYEDKEVIKMIAEGKTIGVFQLESAGMRSTLKTIDPQNIWEVANALSLYRPGPREFIPEYKRKKRYFKVNNEIDEILKESYGIILYQEQIIMIAKVMADYSYGKADILRRSIAKKDRQTIDELKTDFVAGSIKNGYQEEVASKTYDMIAKFANYGFNKAHAYAYTIIAYQLAYLKYHYSDVFYGELFYSSFKNLEKRDEFLLELVRQNVELFPPDILKSELQVSVESGNLRMGFVTINGLGVNTAKQIIHNRQLLDANPDFVSCVSTIFSGVDISQAVLDKMVDAGCFDRFEYNHNTLKHALHNLVNSDAAFIRELLGDTIEIEEHEDSSFKELAEAEKRALSINVKYKLFERVLKNYEHKTNLKLHSIDEVLTNSIPTGQTYERFTLFKILSYKQIITKTGKEMCFLTVESQQVYELTVFSDLYASSKKIIDKNINNFVIGEVQFGNQSLILKKI